jgi:aminoglycoside phosphotransferase (APT) family kinase protein
VLSPADADLVRRDSALPGLATVLDPEALVGALRRYVPGADLGEARITYIKYKPGTVCLTGYQLATGGAVVDVYAKAFGAGAAEKLQKAHEKPGRPGALGQGRIAFDDCQVVVSAFPNDAKVKGLPLLMDAETRFRLLRKLFPDRPALWVGTVQRLVYKPERRYVARLLTEGGASAVLKLYAQTGYEEVMQRQRKTYEARAPLRLASRVGKSDRRAALAFEWLPGRLLSEAILDPQFDPAAVELVGTALAQLHAQSPQGLPRLTRETQAERLAAEASTVGLLCPHLAHRAEVLAGRIAPHLVQRPPVRHVTHGDLHARQVLLDGDTAAILDLDRAVAADPMIDLGLFTAHLEREVIRGHLPADRVDPLMQALLGGYATGTLRPDADAILFYTSVELLRLAPQFFRFREPDWPHRIEASLDRVETLLSHFPVPKHAFIHRQSS